MEAEWLLQPFSLILNVSWSKARGKNWEGDWSTCLSIQNDSWACRFLRFMPHFLYVHESSMSHQRAGCSLQQREKRPFQLHPCDFKVKKIMPRSSPWPSCHRRRRARTQNVWLEKHRGCNALQHSATHYFLFWTHIQQQRVELNTIVRRHLWPYSAGFIGQCTVHRHCSLTLKKGAFWLDK